MHTQSNGNGASESKTGGNGIKTKAVYDYGTINILPYTEINGIRTISDNDIKDIFSRMKQEGTLKTVFYNESITNEDEFLRFFKCGSNFIVVAYLDKEMCGFGWINNLNKTYAFTHFCFFKEYWGEKTDGIGKACLDYFDSWDSFKVFVGMVPAFNKRAIKFVKRMGYTEIGTIPEMVENSGMTILYRKT